MLQYSGAGAGRRFSEVTTALVIAAVIVVAIALQALWSRRERRSAKVAAEARADIAAMGELVPETIHPRIDVNRCMGSGACVDACPEHDVIGVISGHAHLINALGCIGHGACAEACPVQAIQLVYGTEKRGVELPRIDAHFETNQPGVYIVGELGGMGLIRNAVRQGSQAAQHIVAGSRRGAAGALDAVVVGAGPAGISAALQLMKAGLRFELLERESFGGTIAHYPRRKIVMTGTLDIPVYGEVKKRTMSKEDLITLWDEIRERTALSVETGELVTAIQRADDSTWLVTATSGEKRAANVVLALGRRGSPRKLEVPGEELEKVSYRLLEPDYFARQHVLVVGGGNSAVESAIGLADTGTCASVTLSYRRGELSRVRRDNRTRIDDLIRDKKVRALMPSEVVSISKKHVSIKTKDGETFALKNDAVIVQAGGTAPNELLASFGIRMVTKYGDS